MTQIRLHDQPTRFERRFATLRRRLAAGIKWWAEHQAWPATDDVRIDRHQSPCG